MGKSLSLGIRERVVSIVSEGYICHEAARRLRISAASADRIMQRLHRTGSVVPEAQGRPPHQQAGHMASDFPKTRLEAVPDATVPELAGECLEVHRIRATHSVLSRHLIHRLGDTSKKSLIVAERRREKVREA